MASPKELIPSLPETLPEDFSEWDGKAAAAPSPVKSGERDAWEAGDSFGETQKPLWQSGDRDAFLASLVDGPQASSSPASAPVFLKQQEDIIDWDSEATPAPWPVDRTEWEQWEATHSFGKTPKSPTQSSSRDAFLSPAAQKSSDSATAVSTPVIVKQPEPAAALVDAPPSNASLKPEARSSTYEAPAALSLPNVAKPDAVRTSPQPAAATRRKADEAVFQLFSQKKIEVTEEPKTAKKKWMIVGGISAGAILLPAVLMLTMFHHGAKAATKPALQPIPGASDTQSTTNAPATKPPAEGKPLPTAEGQKTTDAQPTGDQQGTASAQVQPTMMNDQLTAPTRIPKQEAQNAPPPDTAGADGLGGGNANVSMFNGHSQPNIRVASSRPVAISSGVATGMLIQRTPPEYPPIAKTAHVAGTVELHATIATDGTIKDLHAVSGPLMLRQAALDAVRNWRYKPYKLNNEPVEVETTVNVVFSLGN